MQRLVSRAVEQRIKEMLASGGLGSLRGRGRERKDVKNIKRERGEDKGRGRTEKRKGAKEEPVVIKLSDSEEEDEGEDSLSVH